MSACMFHFDILFANLMLIVYACRMDDPLIWGVLPISYTFNPSNLRWSLGSYDICFQNRCAAPFHPQIYHANVLVSADSSQRSSTTAKSFQHTVQCIPLTVGSSNQS